MRYSRNLALAATLAVVAILTLPALAHAGTRVNDERWAGTVVAPFGAAGFGIAAAGIAGVFVGGTIFNPTEPAPADAFIDFRMYETGPLASYGFTYSTEDGERGNLDCSLPPSVHAHFTCPVPEGTTQIAVYVFEDVMTEITATLWHVE